MRSNTSCASCASSTRISRTQPQPQPQPQPTTRKSSRSRPCCRSRSRSRSFDSRCFLLVAISIAVVAILDVTDPTFGDVQHVGVGVGMIGVGAFDLGKILRMPTMPFGNGNNNNNGIGIGMKPNKSKGILTARGELLETISRTENGKESPLSTQIKVLGLVDYLESNAPVSETLLVDPAESSLINGVWYLQYTQPSEPEGVSKEDIPEWAPAASTSEVTQKLDTRRANNEGAVSFLGVVSVDTSNKLTTQTIDTATKLFANAVEQDFGTIEVKGTFELDSVPNRIVAAFDTGTLTLKNHNGFVIDFSFLFRARALLKGGVKAGGWLETTYVDDRVRIGRGNRGSLFVLTRDPPVMAVATEAVE